MIDHPEIVFNEYLKANLFFRKTYISLNKCLNLVLKEKETEDLGLNKKKTKKNLKVF